MKKLFLIIGLFVSTNLVATELYSESVEQTYDRYSSTDDIREKLCLNLTVRKMHKTLSVYKLARKRYREDRYEEGVKESFKSLEARIKKYFSVVDEALANKSMCVAEDVATVTAKLMFSKNASLFITKL